MLVGPSGCGKTTAMRMVNRMIDITDGDILLDGASVKDRKPAELRREIGYAIQQIGLFPHLTIADNIGTVPRLLGWDKKRIAARVDELLELVSLDPGETRDRYPAQLSGGQRQRVGVARALAVDPPLMLMDEPFGAIDPINRERLQNEFLRLQKEIRKTIVFVTHDIDEAIKMGDKIAVLQKGGKLAQFASPAELLMDPRPSSSRSSWAPTARSSAWRSSASGTSTCGRWPRCAWARSAPTRARKVEDADLKSHVLVIDDKARPHGWLAAERAGRRARARHRRPERADVEMDDILRDALSDLLASRGALRRGGGRPGAVAGGPLHRGHLRVPATRPRTRPAPAPTSSNRGRGETLFLLAQLETSDRARRRQLRVRERLLPGLDRRQLRRALHGPAAGARAS